MNLKRQDNDKNILTSENLKNALSLSFSREMKDSFKSLYQPRFLGSIHIKELSKFNEYPFTEFSRKGAQDKVSLSLKSISHNPITKYLILLMVIFNILWIIFLYF